MGIRQLIFSILFFLCVSTVNGQDAYIRHTVQAGETVYTISRQYNITPGELVKYNPDAASSLREGSILIIPKKGDASDGHDLIMHTVQPKETLYGLSRQYNCSVEELIALNPELRDGLKIGMVIKVPAPATTEKKAIEDSSKYVYHVVEAKETVYSICRAAGISEEDFLKLNPEVRENGLQLGQTIRLPKERDQIQVKEDVPTDVKPQQKPYDLYRVQEGDNLQNIAQRFNCTVDELISLNPEIQNGLLVGRYIVVPADKKPSVKRPVKRETTELFWKIPSRFEHPTVRIAVLVPLYLGVNDSMGMNQDDQYEKKVYEKSKIGLQFLSGIRVAMDTLAALGYNIQLDVFDTENSAKKVEQIAAKIHPRTDVIIGPLYSKNAEKLARLLPDKTIISPLSKTVNNQGVRNLVDGVNYLDGEYRSMAMWINDHVADRNIVFLNTDTVINQKPVQLINKNLYAADSNGLKYVWVDKQFSQLAQLDQYIVPGKKTTFVVIDQNAAFLSDLLRKLNKRKDSTITLLSTSKIFDIPALENKYLNSLNFIATNIDYVDVADTTTQMFISKYRELTGTEPTRFGYYGYDTGLYFAQLIAAYGAVPDVKEWPKLKGLHKGFNFMAEPGKGPVNTFTFLLGVRNYTIVERAQ